VNIMFKIDKFKRQFPKFCHVEQVFSKEEVKRIYDLEDLEKFRRGMVGSNNSEGEVKLESRDSEIMWVNPNHESGWIFDRFAQVLANVNYDFFNSNINHMGPFQYTLYRENQYYNWHVDSDSMYADLTRKISATIMLSDASDYVGGEFELIANGNVEQPIMLRPNAGDIIFFASHMPHRVRAVTQGVRKSLVNWIYGPWD
jgi:PKHD-type hydroxylase